VAKGLRPASSAPRGRRPSGVRGRLRMVRSRPPRGPAGQSGVGRRPWREYTRL